MIYKLKLFNLLDDLSKSAWAEIWCGFLSVTNYMRGRGYNIKKKKLLINLVYHTAVCKWNTIIAIQVITSHTGFRVDPDRVGPK